MDKEKVEVKEEKIETKAPSRKKKKGTEVQLKLAKRHPANAFRIGSVVVDGYGYKTYILNDEEMEELKTKGCKAWIKVK